MAWAARGVILAAIVSGSAGASALTLTGVCGFPTDASGNWQIGWYNSYGPDGGKNAYVVRDSIEGAFVNSGNDAAAQISIDLSVPGTYKLFTFFDGNEIYSPRDHWGLNLFFDGHNLSPGISAFAAPVRAGNTMPGFQANSGVTLDLSGGVNVLGAGSLVYESGSTQVRLVEYATTADVYNVDRVDNFRLGASGRNDHVTVVGLQVVPEPATVAGLALGVLALVRRRRVSQ